MASIVRLIASRATSSNRDGASVTRPDARSTQNSVSVISTAESSEPPATSPIFDSPSRVNSGSCRDSHRMAAVAAKHSPTRTATNGTGSVIAGRNTCTMTIEAARTSIQNARWAAQNRSSPAAGESDLVVPATTASDRPAESGPRTGTTVASVGGMKVTSR